jgi:hypothetical protein
MRLTKLGGCGARSQRTANRYRDGRRNLLSRYAQFAKFESSLRRERQLRASPRPVRPEGARVASGEGFHLDSNRFDRVADRRLGRVHGDQSSCGHPCAALPGEASQGPVAWDQTALIRDHLWRTRRSSPTQGRRVAAVVGHESEAGRRAGCGKSARPVR